MNTLKFGNGEWYGKKDTILAYNDENSNFKPLPFSFDRASSATVVNKAGLIETVGSGEARIDYKDDSKGALLLEPTRSNSLLQSNQFNTTWTLSASIDLTSGKSGVGGSNNAWLLKKSGSGARYIQQTLSLSSAQYSCSFYLKAESTNWAIIWCYDGTTASEAYFDLENGVVGNTGGSNFNDATIENVGGGWYRCTLTYTSSTTFVRVYPAFDNGSVGANTDDGIYIQNAQLEQGSYATSYIPTQGGVVTRVVENITQTTPNLSNSQEVTAFIDLGARPVTGINSTSNNFRLDFGTGNTRIIYNQNGSSNHRIELNINGSATYYTLSNLLTTTRVKIGVSVTPTTLVIYANGVEYHSVSIASADWSNLLAIETSITESIGNIKINDFKLYNTALTDQELINLTTI